MFSHREIFCLLRAIVSFPSFCVLCKSMKTWYYITVYTDSAGIFWSWILCSFAPHASSLMKPSTLLLIIILPIHAQSIYSNDLHDNHEGKPLLEAFKYKHHYSSCKNHRKIFETSWSTFFMHLKGCDSCVYTVICQLSWNSFSYFSYFIHNRVVILFFNSH